MRFLLVNPFYPIDELPSPPLGVAYLGAALERAGIEVRVVDMVVSAYNRRRMEAVMSEFQPDIVGATSVTMTFHKAIEAIRDARAIDPDVVTAMGGAHVTFCAERTLREHPELDLVALGEGEETIVELTRAVERGRSFAEVPGVVWRDADAIVDNGHRPTSIDVKTLPLPARHLVPLNRYKALGTPISLTTTRGCPFQCIFCVGRQMVGKKVRFRDPLDIVDEIEHLASFGFKQINIADDLFTAKKQHAFDVCDEILRRDLKLVWTSFSNVNTVSLELLRRMREAGCTTVSFGFESGNAEILQTVKKGIKVPRMVEAVKLCKEAGLQAHGSFIVGLPGETPETLAETRAVSDQLKELGALTGFHVLAPFPGTAIYEERERYGVRILTEDWSQYTANRAVTETDTAPRAMQDAVAEEIDEAGARDFLELDRRVRGCTASGEEVAAFRQLEHVGTMYDLMMAESLERKGRIEVAADLDADAPQALDTLARAVQSDCLHPPATIARTLAHALHSGYLAARRQGPNLSYAWIDGIEAAARRPEPRRNPRLLRVVA